MTTPYDMEKPFAVIIDQIDKCCTYAFEGGK